MPGKSRHSKGKAKLSKKSRTLTRQTSASVQATAMAPAPISAVTAAPQPVRSPAPKGAIIEYPYVGGELARIGILAVIVIAALVVLSMILK